MMKKTYGRWINEIAICSCDKCNNETIIKYREGGKERKNIIAVNRVQTLGEAQKNILTKKLEKRYLKLL